METIAITAAGRSEGFPMPMTTFEDMMVEYYAYDFDGNVAVCQVNITVPDDTPPMLQCPPSCREKCAPGYYSETGLAPCAPCPVNFFQHLSGQRECFECHSTETTAGPGTSSKDECRDVECPAIFCEHGGLCTAVHHR